MARNQRKSEAPPAPKSPQKTEVSLGSERVGHRKVALFAVVGLALGIAWPSIAGKRIGPPVPGARRDGGEDEAAASASASARPAPSASGVSLASNAVLAPSAEPATAPSTQRVVVSSGVIQGCWKGKGGKEHRDGADCGKLKLDKMVVPVLEQLKGCPSALGLTGEMSVAIDIDFPSQAIHVKKGRRATTTAAPGDPDAKKGKSGPGELPPTTINGVLACVADYVRNLQADKVPHEHPRYLVEFGLTFYAPGAEPHPKSEEDAGGSSEPADGDMAAIAWDTALVRDEPRTGKVIARLVRGTRVKILGSRKDWYEVKMGQKQGWLYRSALGR